MLRRLAAVIVILVVLPALLPRAVQAQGDLKLQSVEVEILPEYDQPSVLVIYHLRLQAVPADLNLRIPARAGSPHAVAVRQADGSLINLPFEQQVSEDWIVVSTQATMPEVQVEYYDPGMIKQEAARHFEYQWPGDYAVDALAIQVMQPVDATEMRISPSLGAGKTDQDGLTLYSAQYGTLPAGQTFELTIDYQKSTDTLTASTLPVQPSAPITGDTPGRSTGITSALSGLPGYLPVILAGVLGLLLIVGGGVWYWMSGREKERPEIRRRHRAATQREAAPASDNQGHIYCHQCGKRAQSGDRFCRTCGAALRIT
jgi:hypothetical protein